MCTLIPGKVIKVNDETAIVKTIHGDKECRMTQKFSEGDYVLTYSDLIVNKASREEYDLISEAFNKSE